MNRIAALLSALVLLSSAQAGLQLNMAEPPTSPLEPGQNLTLQIVGVDPVPLGAALYLLVQGPGHVDGNTMVYPGSLSSYMDDDELIISIIPTPTREEILQDFMAATGYEDLRDFAAATLADAIPEAPPLTGLLIDDIIFTCSGQGQSTVILVGGNFSTLDTMAISQVPEPTTALLLGLGAVAFARKR